MRRSKVIAPKKTQRSGIRPDLQQVIQGLLCPPSTTSRPLTARLHRFQLVVLSAYKQLRAQNLNILSDVGEDNYDRAFAFLRPGK